MNANNLTAISLGYCMQQH